MSTITAETIGYSSLPRMEVDDTFNPTSYNTALTTFRTAINKIVTDLESLNEDKIELSSSLAFTGTNTFSEYPLKTASYTPPTLDLQLVPKKYVDDQINSVSAASFFFQTSEPGLSSNRLWFDTTDEDNVVLRHCSGTDYNLVSGIIQKTTAPSSPEEGNFWLDKSVTGYPALKRYNGSDYEYVTPFETKSSAPTGVSGKVYIDIATTSQPKLYRHDGATWRQFQIDSFSVATTFSNTVTMTSILSVTGNFAINTDKFTVAASTGNTVIAGTLGVTGIATFTASPVFSAGFSVAAAQTIDFNANLLTEVADPVSDQDAATKAYVDTRIKSLKAIATNSFSISNTASEQTLWSTTIDANTLITSNAYRFKIIGFITNSTGNAKALQFKIKYGGNTVLSTPSEDFASNSNNYGYTIEGYIAANGATNAQIGTFSLLSKVAANTQPMEAIITTGSSSTDSTSSQTLEITVQMESASVNLATNRRLATLEYLYNNDS